MGSEEGMPAAAALALAACTPASSVAAQLNYLEFQQRPYNSTTQAWRLVACMPRGTHSMMKCTMKEQNRLQKLQTLKVSVLCIPAFLPVKIHMPSSQWKSEGAPAAVKRPERFLATDWLQSPPVVRSSVFTVRGLPVAGSLYRAERAVSAPCMQHQGT